MYHDGKRSPLRRLIAAAVCLLLAAALCAAVFGGSGRDLGAQSEATIRAAVQNAALQCYAVEGMYPPDLAYLQTHYGLRINTDDYYVVYEAFSSNLPPTVRVIRK